MANTHILPVNLTEESFYVWLLSSFKFYTPYYLNLHICILSCLGGYYAIEQKNRKLRLLILNTSLYTKKIWITGASEEDPAGQFEWLKNMLEKAKKMKETVFIIGHIPPGKMERYMSSRFGYHAYADQFNKRYLKLVRDYHDVIAGQFFGHFHSDSFRIFYEKLDKTKGKFLERDPISYLFIAPAVSPRKSMFADEIGPNNPGLRLYQFNTTSGQIYDYSQYYLNLTEANVRDRAEWKILYNLTNYYQLNNVSAASLSDLAFSFLKETGTDMFFKYYHANSVGYEDPRNCKDLCRRTHFCVITNVDYQDYERCIQTVFGPSPSSATSAPMPSSQVLMLQSIIPSCLLLLQNVRWSSSTSLSSTSKWLSPPPRNL
ncbi:unnamed protein product [Orchesella dallaii]|uniref:Sphingomyelin phosphodiesterase C-terminal domain-containing protein n=1 Tax=Orchesella dallaii TaxID=48710 RepID=A0ABP1RUS5_9HEXA